MSQSTLQSLLTETCKKHGEATAFDSESSQLLIGLINGWELDSDLTAIQRTFKFKNYYETMAFVNSAAWIAHQQDHHPEMYVTYNQCIIKYSTHSAGGLSRNDFICAAKVNQLLG